MSIQDSPGVLVADPTLFIAICWITSAIVLGGLTLHAILSARNVK
ncbi:MAG: hypothetical protein AAGA69_05685 [Pseudomonadota bacterium]